MAVDPPSDLSADPLPADGVGLLEGLCTTRAIRRYAEEPLPDEVLRAVLFAATRAPSGSNRQPFRFLVLTGGPVAAQAKALVQEGAWAVWGGKRRADGYDRGSGGDATSPKARTATATAMDAYVDGLDRVPALVLAALHRHRAPSPLEGASVYPACQNLLLAARALGWGGVLTQFHVLVEDRLRPLLGIPEEVALSATITLGRPMGGHGPVRRRPLPELVFGDRWGESPAWAVDPPGTTFTQAGPPR